MGQNLLFHFDKSVDSVGCPTSSPQWIFANWRKDFFQLTRFYLKMTYPFSWLIPVVYDRLAWYDIEYPVKPKSA